MGQVEIAVSFLEAIKGGDRFTISSFLADDFSFYGPLPDPIDKEAWLDMQEALLHAMPDWSFHLSDVNQDGDKVTLTVHVTGTHTQVLSLPIPGIPPIPPTGIKVDLPIDKAQLVFKGNKVSALHVGEGNEDGILGIIKQLGVE